MSERVAIQGMPGSYTEQALMLIEPNIDRDQIMHMETFDDVFDSVRAGRAGRAVVAFSNTRIDSIQRPSELLLGHDAMGDFWIDGGVTIPIHHCLAATRGSHLEGITEVVSQPEALRQCGNVLRELNGSVTVLESRDTALSAEEVAHVGASNRAAICSENAATLHGLDILRTDIQDDDINLTRFVRFVNDKDARMKDDEPDNSIVVLTLQQRVGSLDDALSTFTSHGIDMRTIKSRNIPNTDMEVDIIAEIRKGVTEEMRAVVADLANIGATMTVIGTYRDRSTLTIASKIDSEFKAVSVDEEVQKFDALLKKLTGN